MSVVNEVAQVVEATAPDSVAAEALGAVVSTVADPSPLNIINDLEIAIKLAKKLKASLSGMHPSVTDIIKALF